METTIVICGVGLIGGSLALCLKGQPGLNVIGHSPDASLAEKYVRRGVVDSATTSLREAAEAADFIFLCVPVGVLDDYIRQLSAMDLKAGCIISDVGSTKSSVTDCARAADLKPAVFIGGHPMAGSERSGVEAASQHLFENAFYVLTPEPATPIDALERLSALLRHTGAKIVRVDAGEHDEIVAAISHLPHLIAVALVNQVRKHNETNGLYASLAAGGFRDITRIASSEPVVWRDILLNNRHVLLELIEEWQEEMKRFAQMLRDEDGEGVSEAFRTAGEFRRQLPERRKGMLQSVYECYVDVPDHPGIIGRIATELGSRRINLSNLQIIESREDVPGVLRLSFRTQEDLDQAVTLLEGLNHSVRF
ncbi:prephenate dehydrogenase [Paenibacillus beijingensis]|uniref:Prephenate dehydrogenase n=1 Tax=Paenibacillus beijingensis TaxID=1126833 RepID=A0A0D5NQA7_9BACL|nr:prephenate dehydrogenase [Paenibacillus beijingensis]AJY77157.1 prephenate dehydrogenase [Paenibacillus beijingensis]